MNNIVKTVKLQGEGYLVNGTMNVPKAESNGHYRMVQEWIEEGNTPEPEFTPEELAEQARLKKVSEAKSYLSSTDWIVTKIAELQLEGVDVEPLKTKYADELAERKLMREVV